MPRTKTETYRTFSSEETKKLGEEMGKSLALGSAAAKVAGKDARKGAAIFALSGNLGAGKTTFVQGFLRGLGSKKRATSPTFVLMRRHRIAGKKFSDVFHIDAYRLKTAEHFGALEFEELVKGPRNIILIEWPEQAKKLIPKGATWLSFKHGKKENERMITIQK